MALNSLGPQQNKGKEQSVKQITHFLLYGITPPADAAILFPTAVT
jgi:hypothetical protein